MIIQTYFICFFLRTRKLKKNVKDCEILIIFDFSFIFYMVKLNMKKSFFLTFFLYFSGFKRAISYRVKKNYSLDIVSLLTTSSTMLYFLLCLYIYRDFEVKIIL